VQPLLSHFRNGQLSSSQTTPKSKNVTEWTNGVKLRVRLLPKGNERDLNLKPEARAAERVRSVSASSVVCLPVGPNQGKESN